MDNFHWKVMSNQINYLTPSFSLIKSLNGRNYKCCCRIYNCLLCANWIPNFQLKCFHRKISMMFLVHEFKLAGNWICNFFPKRSLCSHSTDKIVSYVSEHAFADFRSTSVMSNDKDCGTLVLVVLTIFQTFIKDHKLCQKNLYGFLDWLKYKTLATFISSKQNLNGKLKRPAHTFPGVFAIKPKKEILLIG